MQRSMRNRHGRLMTIVCAAILALAGGAAFGLTAEERCQVAKTKAGWKLHRCRARVFIKGLKRDLSEQAIAERENECEARYARALEKADRRAQRRGDDGCGHDAGGVLGAVGAAGDAAANFGVNIFGLSGFEDQAAMIATLFQKGVRKFRVNNVGGWPDAAYDAINEEAGKLSSAERAKVSVYVPSQYFAQPLFTIDATKSKFAGWPNIPHWIVQLDACDPVDMTSPVFCSNPTEAGLGHTNMTDYLAQIQDAVPAFQGQPYTVEFVIPYQSSTVSPDDKLVQVKTATVDAFPEVRFSLEQTEYPFWAGSTDTDFPFSAANAFDQFAASKGFAGAYFAETGWPRSCPAHPATATLTNQCAYLTSLRQGGFADGKFVAYWWLMGAEDVGDGCGPNSWGLFDAGADLQCPGAF